MKPLGARVLVQHEPQSEKRESGLIISANSINPNYFVGKVISISATARFTWEKEDELNVGDRIAYLKYGYEDMGDNQHLVEESSLLAVLPDVKPKGK